MVLGHVTERYGTDGSIENYFSNGCKSQGLYKKMSMAERMSYFWAMLLEMGEQKSK